MNNQHTPDLLKGYSVVKRSGKAHAIINNANGAIAAEVYGHNSKDDSGGADQLADLIAAAPELLETLKLCRGNVSSLNATHPVIWGKWLEVIDAAIAKAEGQS